MGSLSDLVVGIPAPTMSVADTPDAPKAQPDQPKESEGPSLAKGSFSSLTLPGRSVAYIDYVEGTQTAPSEPAQPETKPAPAADETAPAPVIASAGGTISIHCVSAVWSLPMTPCFLQNKTRSLYMRQPRPRRLRTPPPKALSRRPLLPLTPRHLFRLPH